MLTEDMEVMLELAAVEGIRQGIIGQPTDKEVLITWNDLSNYKKTWEPYELIQQQFPRFYFEDKVSF